VRSRRSPRRGAGRPAGRVCARRSVRRGPAGRTRSGRDWPGRVVARPFGLTDGQREVLWDRFRLALWPGEITAVVGPSGAGKSVLLDAIAARVPRAIRLQPGRLGRLRRPAVDLLAGPLTDRLDLLSRCGLAEATALVCPARRLSGGQRHRLALAVALGEAKRRGEPTVVLADEFAATLDETTAEVLCAQIRRLVRGSELSLVVASARATGGWLEALAPDRIVVKPLGEPAKVLPGPQADAAGLAEGAGGCRLAGALARLAGLPVERGSLADYRALGRYHYLAGPPAAHKRVYVLRVPSWQRRLGTPARAAVLVVSPPLTLCRGRNAALPRRYTTPSLSAGLRRLNREVETISRVVVHPMYRGCGLAVRLVRHVLATARTPLVEALAVMGGVNPFFERAGLFSFGRFQGRRPYVYYLGRRHARPRPGDEA